MSIAISDLRRLRQPIEPRRRRSIVVAVVVAVAALAGSVAHAQPDEGAAKEAAREIAVAQDRADQAAAAWSQAEAC